MNAQPIKGTILIVVNAAMLAAVLCCMSVCNAGGVRLLSPYTVQDDSSVTTRTKPTPLSLPKSRQVAQPPISKVDKLATPHEDNPYATNY